MFLRYSGRVMALIFENYKHMRPQQKVLNVSMLLSLLFLLSACSAPQIKSNQFAIEFAQTLSAQHARSVVWEGKVDYPDYTERSRVYPDFKPHIIASKKINDQFVGGLSVSGSKVFTLTRTALTFTRPYIYNFPTLRILKGDRSGALNNRFQNLRYSDRALCAAALTPSDTLFLFEPDGSFIQDRERTISNVAAFTFAPEQPLLTVVLEPSWFESESTFTTYNTHTWELESQFTVEGDFADIAYSPNGKHLISAKPGGEIQVFESSTQKLLYTLDIEKPIQNILAMEAPGSVAIQESDNRITIWNYTKKSQLNALSFEHDIEDFTFSNDDRILVLGTDNNDVQYWRIADKALLFTIAHTGSVVGVEVLAQERLLVSNSFGGDLIVSQIPFLEYRNAFTEKMDLAWPEFYSFEYDRNATPAENQNRAKRLVDQTVDEVLGYPVVRQVSFDNSTRAYEVEVGSTQPSAWSMKLELSVDERQVAHLADPKAELAAMVPQFVLDINSNGQITLGSAYLLHFDRALRASLVTPFAPLSIPPQLAALFAGHSPTQIASEPYPTRESRMELGLGKYHALVIGNNDYIEYPDLKTAVTDANVVGSVLSQTYGFDVTQLVDATRADILGALDGYRKTLTEKENLLVFYAGHGVYDDETDRGYWLPVNATKNSSYDWISNADLTDRLKAIKAKHVLVVADSCYSGTLTRGIVSRKQNERYWKRIASKKSRTVLTSGGLEPVLDGGGGEHSVFSRALISTLEQNKKLLDGTELFEKVRKQVIRNADQTPQYSDIRFAGHEGGDFIFKRLEISEP